MNQNNFAMESKINFMTRNKVFLVTGASKGLGRILTQKILDQVDKIIVFTRNSESFSKLSKDYPEQLKVLEVDLNDSKSVIATTQKAIDIFGGIDVLINNAGFGITGATEAYTDLEVRNQLETNLYAPIEITRLVIPKMREQGSGSIIQISSLGGRVGNPGLSIYMAAKFGLSGFSESIAKELSPLGIKVTSVEPGGLKTNWADSSMTFAKQVDGYSETVDKRVELYKSGNYNPPGDPNKVAEIILDLIDHPAPPVHLVLGTDAIPFLEKAEKAKQEEMEDWKEIGLSIESDNNKN